MNEEKLFETNKKEWLKSNLNQWVWIHGSEFEFFPTYDKAVEKAYAQGFDKSPIFVKQIVEREAPTAISGIYRWAV
jgi:hypothetical protein